MSGHNNQPTYKRQRFLLAFIRQLQSVTSTDLQKLVFLHTMSEGLDFYEFVPYRFGSYSFQLAEDLDILRRDGYLSIEHTPKGTRIKAVGDYLQESVFPAFQIATERGNALIRKAYREYPYYAINSEITGQLLRGKELERFNDGRQAYTQTGQILFTIGYEGKSVEAFINNLIQNDIRLLCDIRKNPLSRKFGFSKGKLKHITETIGIKYVHIPELGIESDKRSALETDEDYKCLFSNYAKTLPKLTPLLEQVYSLLRSNVRIALMCYEREPEMCHRHVIRDYIAGTHPIRSEDL
ncbi:MAG TPA: hypothetical protein DD811_01190 [Syntrophomonas sp.]|jgi:hypothetical protein|nr:hypothetical protein [Syntrophomonas sp.]